MAPTFPDICGSVEAVRKISLTYVYHNWAEVYLSWAPVCLDKAYIVTFQMHI